MKITLKLKNYTVRDIDSIYITVYNELVFTKTGQEFLVDRDRDDYFAISE